jgi:tape measure domain-containing protein
VAISNVEIRVNANNAVAQLNRLNGAAGTAAGTFGRLKSAAAGLGLGLIAKSAIQSAASFNDLQTRLKLVTSEFGEFEKAQKLVTRAAKTFGLSNREAAEGVTDIFTRLRPLGIELADIESSFIGFNTVARLSGVSAAGASAAFTQLAQALGSGRLQGDEFRSIAEQIPGLLGAVSLETGVAIGDLKEFASDGKLTTDILIRALKRVEKEGAGKIAAIIKDSDVQRFKDFQNASDELSVSIGQKLLPAVTPLIEGATELLKLFGRLPEPIQTGTVAVLGLAGAAAILGPSIATLNGLIATLAGASVLKAAITGLAVMGEKALAAAAGKTALANAVTAANVKITATTISVGLLSAAITAIPIGLALVAFGNLISRLQEAKKAQDRMTEAIESGSVEMIKSAIAIEEETISVERNRAAKMSLLAINAKLLKSQQRLNQLRAALKVAESQSGDDDDPNKPPVIQPPGDDDETERLKRIAEQSADRVRSLQQQTLLASALTEEEQKQFERQIEIANLLENKRGLTEDQIKSELEATLALYDQQDATEAIVKANEQRKKQAKELADQEKKQAEEAQKALEADPGYQMQQQLEKLLDVQNQVAAGAIAIGNAFGNSFKAVVSGSKTAQEALADMMSAVAEHFLDMAAKIIAQQIAMIIYGTIMKALGVGLPTMSSGSPIDISSPDLNTFNALGGAIPTGYADGGYVSGPTNALIGEGGQSEYVIPENKMRTAMSRYSRGARGAAVIPESGASGTSGEGGGAAVAAPIDVRFNVERINNVDYVTAEQFQVGLQQAAQQGAAEGERRAMGSLRNSAAVRRRIGV